MLGSLRHADPTIGQFRIGSLKPQFRGGNNTSPPKFEISPPLYLIYRGGPSRRKREQLSAHVVAAVARESVHPIG